MTPRAVFDRAHELVREYDLDGFAGMFAHDGVMEIPFASRRLEGRAEIRRVLGPAVRRARERHRIVRYDPLVVHETADPEAIVVEFDLHGEVLATGEPYRISYIQVLRARGGEIASLRDYWNPQALPDVL
jgi:uncharacterized protein